MYVLLSSSHTRTMRSHVMKFLYRYLTKHADVRDMVAFAKSREDLAAACVVSGHILFQIFAYFYIFIVP